MRKIIETIIICLSLIPLIYLTSVASYGVVDNTTDVESSENEIFVSFVLLDNRHLSSSQGVEALNNILDIENLKEYLEESFKNFQSEIDISSYSIFVEDIDVVASLISNELIDCFHINSEIAYSYNKSTLICNKLIVTYNCSSAEYAEKINKIEKAAEELLEEIEDNDSLSDVQKALLIHDRIILNCEYDKENLDNNTVPDDSYNIYGVLGKGVAVCQGYAETYKYLLEKVGIDSRVCSSDELNHAWNIVYIDNIPYHVDVTFDDPTWDISGRVNHNNFLVSSDELYLNKHQASDYDTTPTDTTYDNYFWENSNTAFQLIDGNIYYIDSDVQKLKLYDGTELCDVSDEWFVDSLSYYDSMSRLASDGEDLYYSLSDSVYRYDILTGRSEKVFEPEHDFGEYFYIYGFAYKNSGFYCELYSSPNFVNKTKFLYTIPCTFGEPVFSIEGTIESSISSTDPVTVRLIDSIGTVVDSVETTTGAYTISAPTGEYTLEVSKKNHVARKYTVTVEDKDIPQDMKICLLGDVTMDGSVDILDHQALFEHLQEIKKITDDYQIKLANTTKDDDGDVDILDHQALFEHLQEIKSLFG